MKLIKYIYNLFFSLFNIRFKGYYTRLSYFNLVKIINKKNTLKRNSHLNNRKNILMEEIEFIIERRQQSTQGTNSVDELQKIDIFSTVYALRSKRVEMVQSWVQYKYLYASVSAYACQINSTYAVESDYMNYNA